jgi:AraC-like DNA-binding protein
MHDIVIVNRGLQDLNPRILGYERCRAGKSFGPAVRSYTLIHYVTDGKGRVYKDSGNYEVHAGEAFLILPGEVVTYAADQEDPWSYQWIGFDGELAKSFASLPPVFSLSATFTQKMLETEGRDQREYRIAAALFEMYAALFGEQKTECDYVRRVKDHIRAVYMQELRVEEIARSMNLDRRYLSRYFKEKTGQTVQEYLISVRMEEAQKMLLQGRSVAEAALLSGYQDPFHFSKMFKRRFGISPLAWRAKQL